MASTLSFPQLFRQSLAKCRTAFYMLNQGLINGLPVEESDIASLIRELGNYSYHSGLPVDD